MGSEEGGHGVGGARNATRVPEPHVILEVSGFVHKAQSMQDKSSIQSVLRLGNGRVLTEGMVTWATVVMMSFMQGSTSATTCTNLLLSRS